MRRPSLIVVGFVSVAVCTASDKKDLNLYRLSSRNLSWTAG